LVDREYC